jgi:HEAT repeat protein
MRRRRRRRRGRRGDGGAQIEQILRAGLAGGEATRRECVHKLAGLGHAAVPELFERLVAQLERAGTPATEPGAPDPAAELLVSGLASMPRDDVRPLLATLSRAEGPETQRRALLLCWGECGGAADLELVCSAAAAALDPDGEPSAVGAALEDALSRLARRERPLWEALRKPSSTNAPALLRSFLRAAGRDAGEGALRYLVWSFEALPARRVEALVELQRAALRCQPPVAEEVSAAVRNALAQHPPDVLADLALIAGRFEDSAATGSLVELLSYPSPGVRANALWSLQRITGLGLHGEPVGWQRWYEDELAWWKTSADVELERLRSRDPGQVRMGIVALGKHRLQRERLALAVASTLDHEDGEIVMLACAALEQLGSRASVPALAALLEHADGPVRTSAWTSLCKLTGKDLPPDAPEWKALAARP